MAGSLTASPRINSERDARASTDDAGKDPRLAPTLNSPRLQRIVAVEGAQLVVLLRRRKLVRFLQVDTHQGGHPAEEAAREVIMLGANPKMLSTSPLRQSTLTEWLLPMAYCRTMDAGSGAMPTGEMPQFPKRSPNMSWRSEGLASKPVEYIAGSTSRVAPTVEPPERIPLMILRALYAPARVAFSAILSRLSDPSDTATWRRARP